MDEHTKLLSGLFNYIVKDHIVNILDAGSGKTSLNHLIQEFPNAKIDAIIYYNDERKKNSITQNVESGNYRLIEMDIVKDSIAKKYDLVLAHLLLGEALKFGNEFRNLFEKLLDIETKYLVIVDIKEDTSIDYAYLEDKLNQRGKVLAKLEINKSIPQKFEDFIAKNYVGYIIEK